MENLEVRKNQEEEISPGAEQVETTGVEQEIKEAEAELAENIEELGKDTEELEGLENQEGGLSAKAKKVLREGLSEIKGIILANPAITALGEIYIAADLIRGAYESLAKGRDIKDVGYEVLGQVAYLGIIKSIAYLAWGRKEREERLKSLARKEEILRQAEETQSESPEDDGDDEDDEGDDPEDGKEDEVVDEAPEGRSALEEDLAEIARLKAELDKAYGPEETK